MGAHQQKLYISGGNKKNELEMFRIFAESLQSYNFLLQNKPVFNVGCFDVFCGELVQVLRVKNLSLPAETA